MYLFITKNVSEEVDDNTHYKAFSSKNKYIFVGGEKYWPFPLLLVYRST